MNGVDRSIVFKIAAWDADPHAVREDSGIHGTAPQIKDKLRNFNSAMRA